MAANIMKSSFEGFTRAIAEFLGNQGSQLLSEGMTRLSKTLTTDLLGEEGHLDNAANSLILMQFLTWLKDVKNLSTRKVKQQFDALIRLLTMLSRKQRTELSLIMIGMVVISSPDSSRKQQGSQQQSKKSNKKNAPNESSTSQFLSNLLGIDLQSAESYKSVCELLYYHILPGFLDLEKKSAAETISEGEFKTQVINLLNTWRLLGDSRWEDLQQKLIGVFKNLPERLASLFKKCGLIYQIDDGMAQNATPLVEELEDRAARSRAERLKRKAARKKRKKEERKVI